MADLFETIGAGDIDRVRDLLDRDPDLAGTRNADGLSAVLHALYTGHPELAAYFERLMGHPPVACTIDQARPYFEFYPGRGGLSRRFFDPANV